MLLSQRIQESYQHLQYFNEQVIIMIEKYFYIQRMKQSIDHSGGKLKLLVNHYTENLSFLIWSKNFVKTNMYIAMAWLRIDYFWLLEVNTYKLVHLLRTVQWVTSCICIYMYTCMKLPVHVYIAWIALRRNGTSL